MPAARTLRGITKVISFVAAIDILFEIAADTAHTGKLRFPGIIFPLQTHKPVLHDTGLRKKSRLVNTGE